MKKYSFNATLPDKVFKGVTLKESAPGKGFTIKDVEVGKTYRIYDKDTKKYVIATITNILARAKNPLATIFFIDERGKKSDWTFGVKDRIFYRLQKKESEEADTIAQGVYAGFTDDAGLKPFSEDAEINIVRKFLYRDLVRNHKIPMSRAKSIVDTLFRVYDTLIAAFEVSNSLLTTTMSKVNSIVDKLQDIVNRRGGDVSGDVEE